MILYYLFSLPMITLLFIGFFIYIISSNRALGRRVSILEQKNKQNVSITSVPASTVVVPAMNVVNSTDTVAQKVDPVQNYNYPPVTEAEADTSSSWFAEDWLMKLGAFIFIIGFGWFVSYAFANNWVGPIGRITIGIVAGILLMLFGFKWMMKYVSQGGLFMSLGAGMTILTIFAGRSIYGFFSPFSAITFDFIIIAFIAFASYRFKIMPLAAVGQVLAFITPLLVAGKTDTLFLFSYLFFVSLATLVLAGISGWRNLITSSLVFVSLYSIPYLFGFEMDALLVLNFIYMFSLLYLFTGMMTVIKKGVQNVQNEIYLAVFNGLFLFVWIYAVAPKEWAVLIFSLWAILFAISSALTIRSGGVAAFYSYGSVAVAYLGAATALQLSGAALIIAFIIEIFLLVIVVSQLTRNLQASTRATSLFAIPIFLSINTIVKFSNATLPFTEDFFVLFILAFTLIFTGRYLTNGSIENKDNIELKSSGVYLVLGMMYLGYIIWQLVHIFLIDTPDFGTMVSLMIFTVIGLVAYFNGLYTKDMTRRTYGTVLIAFVVSRLLIVDVWDMELFGRVITLIVIGVMLMSTAFITRKNKHEIL